MDFLQKELGFPPMGQNQNQHHHHNQGGNPNYMPPQQHVLAKIVNNLQMINMCGPEVFSESYISANTCVASENGAYFAKLQDDGNFVLYCST